MERKPKTCCLPHFTPEMTGDVKGGKLSSYAIALEAWRRGLKVVLHDRRMVRYTISNVRWRNGFAFSINLNSRLLPRFRITPQNKSYTFNRSRLVNSFSEATRKICSNKDITKHWLRKKYISVPGGKRFNSSVSEIDIIKYVVKEMGFPVVLKPAASSLGQGVFVNISDETALKKYLTHVRRELGYSNVIVEEYVKGEDLRVFVSGSKALCAVKRMPANVTGDGKKTVKRLIEEKNLLRKTNPFLANRPIKIDKEVINYLEASNYSVDSVPKNNEVLFLRGKGSGGDPIDVTDEISESTKDLAVRAVKAIPHLHNCGVDIIVDKDRTGKESAVVIELNDRAHIGLHLFPFKGKARDVAGDIIDYFFPESAGRRGRNSRVYFDPDLVVRPFINGQAKDIVLPSSPTGKIKYRCFELKGKVQEQATEGNLQRKALKLNLNGYARGLGNGNLQVVLVGKGSNMRIFKSFLSRNLKFRVIKEYVWQGTVTAGFRFM